MYNPSNSFTNKTGVGIQQWIFTTLYIEKE